MPSLPISKKLDLAIAAIRGADLEAVEISLTARDLRALKRCAGAPVGSLAAGFYRGVQVTNGSILASEVVVRMPDGFVRHAPIKPRAFARWLTLPDGWPPLDAAPAKRAAVA